MQEDSVIIGLKEKCKHQASEISRLQEELNYYKKQIENSAIISTKTMELMDDPLYLEKIVALMPGLIYWHDRNGVMLGCNDEEAKALGFSSRYELIGKTPYDVFSKEDAEKLIRNNDLILNQGKPHITEEEVAIMGGVERTFISQKVPLKNTLGQVIGFLGISLDITDRKNMEKKLIEAMEKAQAADHAKTEFLANMSHDIRTPFVGIIGIAEHLFKTEKDENRKKQVELLLNSSRQLLSLLNDVLAFSQVESGINQIKKEKVNLKVLIQEVNLLIMPQLKENVDYNVELATNLPEFLCVERSRIKRILLNLLSNAAKFTEKGSIALTVSWNEALHLIEIQVQDTGIGIPKAFHTEIFEKFSRVKSSYKQLSYQGSGLGLYVVKRFVEELQGTFSIQSEENNGACFTVKIPAEKGEKESDKLITNSAQFAPTAFNVLLVEDNPIAQLVTSQILEESYCKVDIAGTIASAKTRLKENHYHVIFLDLGLPDGRGDALISLIRESQEGAYIVALTASNENTLQGLDIDIFMSKPLEREACSLLLQKISLAEGEG